MAKAKSSSRTKVKEATFSRPSQEDRLTGLVYRWMRGNKLLTGKTRKELYALKKDLRGEIIFFFS
jgi:hypothetical protein